MDKSWERLFEGKLGLSIEVGKRIMEALQHEVVSMRRDLLLFRPVCPDM